jgi:hypothetical protein
MADFSTVFAPQFSQWIDPAPAALALNQNGVA